MTEGNDPKTYARRLVKGSAIVFAALVASGLIAFLLRMFLARSFSVEEYGLFYVVFALISFFALFRDFGLDSGEVRPRVRSPQAVRRGKIVRGVYPALPDGLFPISFVLFVLSGQIALVVFRTVEASPVIKILSVWVLTAIFSFTFKGYLRTFRICS